MTTLQRPPMPALRPFVSLVWASEGGASRGAEKAMREHALPSGLMHLVLRLSDLPLRIADPRKDPIARTMPDALVGGARSGFYVRECAGPTCSVGAVLRPGAAPCLFGVGADELAERHTPLEDLWGLDAHRLRARLRETQGAEDRLALLETALLAHLPRVRGLHPAIATTLSERSAAWTVADAVQHSGVSHRRFIALFRESVGLAPKSWLRVQRFQQVLTALGRDADEPLAALAADAGYSDQSHFNRDFLAFTGVTPQAYRRLSPAHANHLPIENAPPRRA
jgi:AraC-like DNA-binding protein